MTSRERLMAVIKHERVDRVPISTYELIGWNKNSWENRQKSYKGLMNYIRDKTDCLYMTGVGCINKYVRENTHIERYEEGNSTFIRTTIVTPKGDLTKLNRIDEGVNTSWQIEHLVKSDMDIEKFLSIPDDLLPVNTNHLREIDTELGDKGILMIDIADPLCIVADLFKFGDFTIKAYTDKKTFKSMLDKVFEQQMYFLRDMLNKGAGPLFRVVGAEYATAPYLGPEQFHEYVCRYDKKMIQLIHYYKQFARVHCHGRIRNILSHIIEMEADAIDPVEAPPSGDINLSDVKKLYGDRLCLMGNVQLKDLEYANPEEMRKIIVKCMEDGKKGGNYVLMPTAAPINEPISPITERNYKIMIDTALEYGWYK